MKTARKTTQGEIRIGISGWTYAPWRGVFFPEKLVHKKELTYAAGQFRSIEINGTFYALQRPVSFERWAAETPDDFVFSIKAVRFITHIRRLTDVEKPLANFLASGVLKLGKKLGPILWQFPPSFRYDRDLMAPFLAMLPHDTDAAVKVAEGHDPWMQGRAWTESDAKRPLRHAIEIRHESFRTPEFITLLRDHNVALVCADTVKWPRLMDLTSDFVYCRLHGSQELYASGYDAPALDAWSERVTAWARGAEPVDAEKVTATPGPKYSQRDVFVYFDNDLKVKAPFDAKALETKIKALTNA